MSTTLRLALQRCRQAPFIVDVLHDADQLARAAAVDGGPAAVRLLGAAIADTDELTAVAAVHAMADVFDDAADAALSELLSHPRAFLREHAAWALQSRLPRLDAIGRLVAVVVGGGFSGVLAQRTLAHWAGPAPDHVALALEGALGTQPDPAVRARLVETLGLVPSAVAGRVVRQVAADPEEPPECRAVAVAALGDRVGDPAAAALVHSLRHADGELGAVARLAAYDLRRPDGAGPVRRAGLTVAQLFLHADIDTGLSRAGAGDNGGIATLLVRLGGALVAEPGIGRVLTLSRGTADAALAALTADGEHLLTPVPLPRVAAADAWPARIAAARGIRRVLRALRPDVLHLRMAEVGSLAAAEVAAELGIPVVFTVAPDPHASIHALDMTGGLHRGNFGAVDEREHYWFRARLVQRLAADAAHTVLFPRADLREDLRTLLGLELEPARHTVVPEGIDLRVTEVAAAEVARAVGGPDGPALAELRALTAGLPAHRRGLPLAISVGRLHRVKGMATLVQAWAGDEDLREECNLVIVGGDLVDPSPDERGQLALVEDVLRRHPEARDGLLLPGHRPNDVVARWLAAAHAGLAPEVAPGGVYVCGSLKEEFGLALLEALAAGLPVLAPAVGGPATYVEDGITGVLVDTSDPARVARGFRATLALAAGPGQPVRVGRARQRIRADYTVQAMARTLGEVYATVTRSAGRP